MAFDLIVTACGIRGSKYPVWKWVTKDTYGEKGPEDFYVFMQYFLATPLNPVIQISC
jgi:hypothetical protein